MRAITISKKMVSSFVIRIIFPVGLQAEEQHFAKRTRRPDPRERQRASEGVRRCGIGGTAQADRSDRGRQTSGCQEGRYETASRTPLQQDRSALGWLMDRREV